MAPESNPTQGRVVLVEGDPVLGMDAIKALKRNLMANGMLPDGWIEMSLSDKKPKGINEFLNALDGELSMSDWDGNRKCVLLRGLPDVKQFAEAVHKVLGGISPTNTLIVFDEDGTMKSSKNSAWKAFREACGKIGEVMSLPVPFDELDGERQKGTNQVRAVVEEVAKRGKKISSVTVRDVFLEKVMPNWSYVISEVEKLVDLSAGETITPQEVNDIVFPTTPNYAIYEFSIAFNSGMFNKTMDAYDSVIASKPDDPKAAEGVVAYAMKLCRWQLIAAHLLSYGQQLPDGLVAIANRMSIDEGRKRTERDKAIHPRWFTEEKDPAKKKVEEEKLRKSVTLSPFEAKGVSDFTKNVFTRRVPVTSGGLGKLPFHQVAMLRYLAMFDCMQKIRFAGRDKQAARQIFRQAVYKTCWRG